MKVRPRAAWQATIIVDETRSAISSPAVRASMVHYNCESFVLDLEIVPGT